MKKKIAVIGLKGLPSYVGAGTVGENIINQLRDEFDFYVYATSSHTKLPSGYYNGVYQKVFRKLPFKKFNAFWYYLVSALHARFRGNFDLVHVHNSFAAFTIGILNKKYPVVLTTHGGFNIVDKWKKYAWFWTFNTNKLVKKADYLCCVSKDEQRKFKNLLNLDAHYIPNGINLVSRESLPAIKVTEPYIFFASGRIIRSKGLHDLINALHKINYKGKLIVAGDMEQIKSYSAEIMNMIGDLNIEFLGLIKEKQLLFSYIAHARFFVYPSHIEAMSMMLLEAVTVDCPIICSDIIPNQDILNQDEVLFFKTKDPDDLAEKINLALVNPDKMKEQAQKAKMRFIKEFNWISIAQEYKNIFNTLMNKDLNK
jgi:glycosyltransferase involved in cell wall biosynthesis